MKNNTKTLFMFFISLGISLASNAIASDNISVLKIDTLIMEKGSENYSLMVKAFVKNNGEADDVMINVIAIDFNSFELENVTLSGYLKQGQTKVLVTVVKIPKNVYEEIVRWERKK